jgi:uncharacterized protein YbjQ (UPF0145 family)
MSEKSNRWGREKHKILYEKSNFIMRQNFGLILLIASLLIGCSFINVKVLETDSANRPPKVGKLDVYNASADIKKPYQQIAIIEAGDYRTRQNQNKDELLNVLFAKAKELGADGVVILSQERRINYTSGGTGGSVEHEYLYAKVMAFIY